jgi:hypothetical protein
VKQENETEEHEAPAPAEAIDTQENDGTVAVAEDTQVEEAADTRQ